MATNVSSFLLSILDNTARFTIPATVSGLQAEYKVTVQLPWQNDKPLVDRLEEVRASSFILKSRVLCSSSLGVRNEWTIGDLEMETSLTNSDTRLINDIKVMLKVRLTFLVSQYSVSYGSLLNYSFFPLFEITR